MYMLSSHRPSNITIQLSSIISLILSQYTYFLLLNQYNLSFSIFSQSKWNLHLDKLSIVQLYVDLILNSQLHQVQTEQKWITSLEFIKQHKDLPPPSDREKYIQLVASLYLKINFNEVGKLPVNDLQVVDLDIEDGTVRFNRQDWIPVSIHGEERQVKDIYRQKYINIKSFTDQKKNSSQALVLCYHCDESTQNAITDIEVLKSEKGRGEKDVFNVPQGYKMLNHTFSHKGRNKYLLYKRASNKLQLNYAPIFLESYPMKPSESKISLQMLPQFCFPQGVRLSQEMRGFITFSFVLSSLSRIYCSCMIIKQILPPHLKKKLGLKQQKIYFQKSICIVSEYSYPEQFCQVLQHLYRVSMSKNDVPFHIVIQQLVQNLLMVNHDELGKVAITYPYGGCNVVFYTSLNYPIVSEKSIYTLCKFLSTQNIILLYEALLLQKQIFLVSQSKTVIGLISQAIEAILFPFKWQHVFIPVLPSSLEEYTQAIVPFIIGIPPSFVNLQKQECIFIDIDHNQFINGEQMPPIPDKLQKQLAKRLQNYQYYIPSDVQEYLENPQNTYIFQMKAIDYPQFDPYDVRDAFLEFNTSLMRNYNKFWNKSKKEAVYRDKNQPLKGINELFSVQGFLDDLNMSKIGSFGYKFTETSIFSHFIQKRCKYPLDPYFVFFDQCIQKKKKKKQINCIFEMKPQKFRVTPPPVWDSSKQKAYHYESFPSILHEVQELDLNEIQLQIDIENQQQNQRQNMFNRLLQKHSVYKGLFQPIGEQIPSTLQKLNLQTQIQTLAKQLLNQRHLDLVIKEISQMSEIKISSDIRTIDSDIKSKRDLRTLELINQRLLFQISEVNQFNKYFQFLLSDTLGVNFKDLSSQETSESKEGVLLVSSLLQDVKSLKGTKRTITFDNRRSSSFFPKNTTNIVIHNTSTKHLLNNFIRKQPKKFYSFVTERILQEQIVWVFDHFLLLKDWKS